MAKVNKIMAVLVATRDVLINRFGFEQTNIKLLTDAPAADGDGSSSTTVLPTGANIKAALSKMVSQAEAGDVLFFHYSGRGTRQLVNQVPEGASFTILADSCHSGGLIDKEKEQIGPSTYKTTSSLSYKPKSIPFESILEHLSSLTGINSSDIGTHLLESFGSNASLKFLVPQLKFDLFEFLKPDEGILLSGCQADETSADMNPMMTESGGKAYGAFSNAIQMVLKENPGGLSNKQVVMMARKVLEAQGFDQHPCLYCSDRNADVTFLSYPNNKPSVSEI
ncbi:Metacaspase-9 [Hibiscus syriacus]|uniref:Metacaspase-9 n=1 Tax=Hibiscus syriacus TaxID=106335 RepID=A0A6A2ZEP3_HIBSY|nr:Metacaspase-9 [Hibiscus syriacus]